MKNYFYTFVYKIYSNKWILSIKDGLLKIKPLILIGCFLQIFLYMFDIAHYLFIIDKYEIYISSLYKIRTVINIALIYSLPFSISSTFVDNFNKDSKNDIKICSVIPASISVTCTHILNINYNNHPDNYAIYIFKTCLSFVFVLITSQFFIFVYKYIKKIKLKKLKYYDKIYENATYAIIPSILTILMTILFKFAILNKLFDRFIILGSSSESIFFTLKDVLLNQLIWFFGGNGGHILYGQSDTPFYVILSNLGGAGSTICLLLAIYILKPKRQSNINSPLIVITSFFNINEPIIYGLPIIFNPIYLIPFILVPLISTLISLFALYIGFINIDTIFISSSMPIFINGYFLTGDFSGVIVQIINLVIGTLIYIPFVKLSDKVFEIEVKHSYNKFKYYNFSSKSNDLKLINRTDSIGRISKILSIDLYNDLIKENGLYLEYQPQVNKHCLVIGVEALFRWKHSTLGNIPPNIAIYLAEESGYINKLGKWIIKKSCAEFKEILNESNINLELSINISSTQLKDPSFYVFIKSIIEENNLKFSDIKLEITETSALGTDSITISQIKQLSYLGVKFAIDDFGEGYNPILYIKRYSIDTIKLDGSLIRDIEINKDSLSIVDAMYTLCENSDLNIVCEFVENENQKAILDSLGDGIYQGYLFSKPLKAKDCLKYINENKKTVG
ncbi:EAL domain-containing protein [Clostridium sp.]|uniref:EAL domain-containing protein n=1 Tax=Clostridium sp. TaxID=1506 RepID=UPI003F2F5162